MQYLISKRVYFILLLLMNGIFAQNYLKILSYNIQGMRPGSDPETRLFHTIQNLKSIDPDIIGIQEINEDVNGTGQDNQGKRITDSLSAYFNTTYYFYQSFTHLSWNNQFREYIGIISKFPVMQQGFKQLPAGTFPRKVVWNSIGTPIGIVNFFNTHLSFNSNIVRTLQVQAIIPYVFQKENSYPGIASILTGDFNAIPGSDPIVLLTHSNIDSFYFDSFREINPISSGYTVPANNPDARIDFIFLKNTGNIEIDTSLVVMNQPYSGNNYCSDHYGVVTNFLEDTTGSDIILPHFIDFEDVVVNSYKDNIISVSNPGTGDLIISNLYANDSVFSVSPQTLVVSPGGSDNVTISFTPLSSNNFNGHLAFENNAGRDRYIFLSGRGTTIDVISELNFGNVLINTSEDTVIAITNPTTFDITVSDILSSNPNFTVNPTNFIVPPGGEQLITGTFSPDSTGVSNGMFTFVTTAGNPTVLLTGIGLEPSSWIIQPTTITADLLSLFFNDVNTGWAVGQQGKILFTNNGGADWIEQSSGTTNTLRSVFFINNNTGWTVGDNGRLLKTTDGGATWESKTSGTSSVLVSVYFTDQDTGWIVGTAGVIRKTTDGGINWSSQQSGTLGFLTEVYLVNNNIGWCVGESGTILKTINSGTNWGNQTSTTSENLWDVHFNDLVTGWAVGENNTILNTQNGGDKWFSQNNDINQDLYSVFFSDSSKGWIVGTDGIILRSENGGNKWIPQYTGVNYNLNSVYFSNSNVGYIAGSNGLILKTTNGGIITDSDKMKPNENIIKRLNLKQNFPNPFNSTTKIIYDLPDKTFVILEIYNIYGQIVRSLVKRYQNEGRETVYWDGKNDAGKLASSGIYFTKLKTNLDQVINKMILLR